MQQRGVLRHKPDLRAQAVLGDECDILPIDQDAPAFQIVEAQQDIDKRGLARARRPDQADFLARLDGQRQVFEQAAVPAVMKADVLVADLAARSRTRPWRRAHRPRSKAWRALPCLPAPCRHSRKSPVMTHMIQPAMLLMRITRPVVTAMAPSEIVPRLQSQSDKPGRARDEHAGQNPLRHFEAGDQPELRLELLQMIGDRLLGVSVLAFGMGEQLDGQDVGVAVDDPAGQQRARLRNERRALDQLRHERTRPWPGSRRAIPKAVRAAARRARRRSPPRLSNRSRRTKAHRRSRPPTAAARRRSA